MLEKNFIHGIDDPNEPRMGRLQVINRIEIPKGDFTYDIAVKRIIKEYHNYQPFAIYTDAGHGKK